MNFNYVNINRQKQNGVALIVILLIVAIVAALATQMHWQHRISLKRIDNLSTLSQARQYAIGGENWAREILLEDLKESTNDNLKELWAEPLPPLPIEGGAIQGQMYDLQSRFNLNNLISKDGKINRDSVAQFKRLLRSLEIDENYAVSIADWIDSDNYPEFPGGAEDSSYSSLPVPYLTANQYITDISELMNIKDMNKSVYQQLKPFVAALPVETSININTASAEVLVSINQQISTSDIDSIISSRESSPFESVDEFYRMLNLDKPDNSDALDIQSEYFLTEVEVLLHDKIYRRHIYLFRDSQSGSVSAYQYTHSPTALNIEQNNNDQNNSKIESG
ncbi:MAG: type II secretion system minor pseudopilin GspK [Gammaproteobacteria bacterium]|nr:type II secretion system minor pseudopilin GspK [Gammaproteobacteria bacterium]NNC97375.1 type II secretion system minor pseudopilin GspK [Gammaproteobacteria bacterium]NNM13106.1 type II secretion system minor pseudopilin GspK [Gammaproteobacteria bacterium]